MNSDLGFTQEGRIGLITLNRPSALNALTLPMIEDLHQQLIDWEKDSNIKAVVIQSSSEKAFCAGGDVRWLYEAGLNKNPQQMQFFWQEYRLNNYIHNYSKPYIAMLDGLTMGGGVGISLHGSYPIASERFTFAMPETGIGFFPDIGASYLLSRCPDNLGIYLGLTGNRLNAYEAKSLGLVKEVVESVRMDQLLQELIESDEAIDRCLSSYQQHSLTDIAHKESISNCFAKETVEEIIASLGALSEDWSEKMLSNLQKKAPLSLKITLEQIQRAKHLSLAECLQMDYRLVTHFMQDSDFYEGVRALLVDKDQTPKWNPARLEEITQSKVADYFAEVDQELVL